MAMNPMQKKARTSFLLGMFLTLVITGLVIVFLIMQLGKLKQEQDAIVYRTVYVVSQDITSGGTVLGNVRVAQIISEAVPSNAITDANAATYITDVATTKIDLEIGTVITTDMINPEGQADSADVRLQEYNMIILPSQLTMGECVDIRLRLPTGEDYIVLSKKYIEQTSADTVWIKVSEDEILTMSNAIVEAYIMEGSLLYATTYVDAGLQGSATPTYTPSSSVRNLISVNPNITAEAKAALQTVYNIDTVLSANGAQTNRDKINQATGSYQDDALSNIEERLEEEVQEQQAARQEYIDTLGI